MVPKKAWDLIENVIIASIAGCRGGAWSSSIGVGGESTMESSASDIWEYDDRPLDLHKVMRLAVTAAHDPSSSSSASSRIRDCNPTPPNCGGRSSDAARWALPRAWRAASSCSAPTHLRHADRCASSADCIHFVDACSFGTDFKMWVRRGTVEPMSILWASREKPISATSTMNDSRTLCFSSFFVEVLLYKGG